MIPENRKSTLPVTSRFIPPDDQVINALIDYELGGVALNDPSQGLQVQKWTLNYDSVNVVCTPEFGAPTTLFAVAGITELSLAFDQNMRPTVAYMVGGVAYLWWWDTTNSVRATTSFGVVRSPRVCLDDKRTSQFNNSDVIFAYVRGTTLYFRQQRDRYTVERPLATGLSADALIRTIGMSRNWRLQFELA